MASKKMRPTRYAHLEGHTDVCYTDDGKYMVTCGADGEVRIFEGLDDDDCKTHVVAESAHAIAYRDGCFMVGTDSNLVQAFSMDEGSPNGIITRFTAPATHIITSKDKKLVVCAGSDMQIKVHDTVTYRDTTLNGHQAPVLSVAIDPKGEYVASSSCDGSVRVWDMKTTAVHASWAILPKSNNFSSSQPLCRLTWSRDGKFLYVPVEEEVRLYERDSWEVKHTLKESSIKQAISIVSLSSCGKFLAGACLDGVIVIWDLQNRQMLLSEQHPKALPISGLCWNPNGKKEVAFVNVDGQLGTIENIDDDYVPTEGENGLVNGVNGDADFPPLDIDMNDMDDDDEFSISKIKAKLGFADDEDGTYVGPPPEDGKIEEGAGDDDTKSIISKAEPPPPAPTFQLPEVQKPFQPGMSPEFLNDRYMVWNNVGIVRQFVSDEENSIDVEFHDTSVHHPLHLNNNSGHTMAALSNEALVLACEKQDDQPSKLVVQHFSGWGGGKEWYVDMPAEEEILAIGLGAGWVAAATDKRNLRIFSTSGIQRDIISIPGPIVCLAGLEDQLMFVFHSGMGVSGDQHMSAVVLNIKGGKHLSPVACPIPLAPKSFLAWAGFSDEGTPAIMDSTGIVRLMHLKYGINWTNILNTKNHTRGKSDHYFLVGMSEIQGNVRCILCKGSRYPPVLPKPHVSLIDMQVPLCELDTEKGELEEKSLRFSLLLNSLERLSRLGFDVDESKNEADKNLKGAMIKLFALACRTDRESRAVEVCQLMPSYHTVQLAIRYASKLQRLQLAERLGEVASSKMEEEFEKESRVQMDVNEYFPMYGAGGGGSRKSQNQDSDDEAEASQGQEEEIEEVEVNDNPLLAASTRKDSLGSKSNLKTSSSQKNPFKRDMMSGEKSGKRGIDIIDRYRKSQKKPESSPVLRPIVKKTQSKQTTLKKSAAEENETAVSDKENKCENVREELPTQKPANPFKKKEIVTEDTQKSQEDFETSKPQEDSEKPVKKVSALQLWLADHKDKVREEFPQATDAELLAKAAMLFKDVDNSVKQKYKTQAAGTAAQPVSTSTPSIGGDEKKRKLEESNSQESPLEKKSKGSGIQKLAAFAFNKS